MFVNFYYKKVGEKRENDQLSEHKRNKNLSEKILLGDNFQRFFRKRVIRQ